MVFSSPRLIGWPLILLQLLWDVVVVVRSQTIAPDTASYAVGEPIEIAWDYPRKDSINGDWIGIYDSSSLSQGGTLPAGSIMWVFARSLTQTYQKGKRLTGTVTFDSNPPDESGTQSWPLQAGSYQAHIIRDETFAPYAVVASSFIFTVSTATTPNPTSNPTPDPQGSTSVTATKNAYAEGEDIVVDVSYPDNPGQNAWIGLWPSGSDPNSLPSPSAYWNYFCSDSQSSACGTAPTAGWVTLNSDSEGDWTWPLTCGTWRAFLIPSGSAAASYGSVAASQAFTVGGSATCDDPPIDVSLTASKSAYSMGEDIVIDVAYPDNPGQNAWISLWPADSDPQSLPSPSPYWNYFCSDSQSSACGAAPTEGTVTLNADSEGSWTWPLTCGTWKAYLIPSGAQSSFYSSVASTEAFMVGGSATCENQVCNASPEDDNPSFTHAPPVEGAQIDKVAFGSCYKPGSQNHGSDLWQHVRANFGSAGVFNWLGDNMYMDSNDSQAKRNAYNAARSDSKYSQYGPVAEPRIPVTGTWDDHDYGFNNDGSNYECRQASQNEFVYHFAVPDTDPRHPTYAGGQQEGVYSANMFQTDAGAPGIHLINLDARYHRSPTFSYYGACEGAASTILGAAQWAWLENELGRPSEIKVIGSGTQVLPPTYRGRSLSNYCAYDGNGNAFDAANLAMGEGLGFDGTSYESWAEIPQERARLLNMVQESINAGNAKHVIFISGDQHWAEMMVKEIPERAGQAAVSVYEVTASGIDQNWPYQILNSNRLNPGDYGFQARRALQNLRIPKGKARDNVRKKEQQRHLAPKWKTPGPTPQPVVTPPPTKSPSAAPAPVPVTAIKSITYSGANSCYGDALFICDATANYGGIQVDWANQEVHLSIFTPFETQQEAARVTLDLRATSASA